MDGFLADLAVAGILGEIRDIAVHFAVHLDALDHLVLVGLQAAVHVMEFDARDLARRPVVELGRKVLRKLVVLAVLFPAGNDIVALFLDHPVQFRDLVRGVLQVRVHGDDDVAFRRREALVQGGGLAIVSAEGDAVDSGILLRQGADGVPGTIGGAVVHHQDLVGPAVRFHDPADPGGEFRQGFGFVIEGYDNRDIHSKLLIIDIFIGAVIARVVPRVVEGVLHIKVAGHDAGQQAAVQEAIDPLADEGVQRKFVHEPADLAFVTRPHLRGNGGVQFGDDALNGFLWHFHDEDGIHGGEDKTGEQGDAAPKAVCVHHRHPVELVAEVQHVLLHQEDTSEEFYRP